VKDMAEQRILGDKEMDGFVYGNAATLLGLKV